MCAVFSQIHHLRVLPPEHQAHTSSSSKDRPTWTAQRHLKPHVSQPRAFTSSTKLFFFQHDLSTWVGSSPSQSPRQECRNVDIIPTCPPLLSHHADSLLTHSFIIPKQLLSTILIWWQNAVAAFMRLNQSLNLCWIYQLLFTLMPRFVFPPPWPLC